MRIGPDGEPDGVTGDLAALLEREFDEDPALWVARSLEPKLADLARDGSDHIVSMPPSLGGVTLVARVLPEGDDPDAGHVVILKDRRQLDALQNDLRLASRMREIAARFEQTAHDLKAPLQALALNLALIREDIEAADVEDDVCGRVDVLDDEVARLQRMLKAVMDDWRLPKATRLRRIDVGRLVREIAKLVEPQAAAAGIDVHCDVPRGVLVMAARDALKQAIVNVVNNAVEAMRDSGRGSRLELRVHADDDSVTTEIRDDGPGVPDGLRDKIFGLHFTTKRDGNGIGLFTSRTTVEQLGGSLELATEVDRGTTVRIQLPRSVYDKRPAKD